MVYKCSRRQWDLVLCSVNSSKMAAALLILLAALGTLAQAEIFPRHVQPPIRPPLIKGSHHGSRITGGEEAEPHSIPYQAALFIEVEGGTAFCGGSLISPSTVLTAAHCADGAASITVILGAHQVQQSEATQVTLIVTNITVHPQWDPLFLVNDLALLHLDAPVTLDDNIGVVSLQRRSEEGETLVGAQARVSGWGLDSDQATTISPVLRQVEVPIIENLLCTLFYLGVIQPSHICASGDAGKSSCSGDSGGPLVHNGEQIGLVSFGIALGCEAGWPSVYTRLSQYLEWIAANSDVVIQ